MSLRIITVVTGRWRENCHIAANSRGDAIIVDPGGCFEEITARIEENGWRVAGIVNTHAHYDHVGAVAQLQERYGAPFYLHGADAALLRRANLYRLMFESQETIKVPTINHDISGLPSEFTVGSITLSWIATPGHTDGSVCLKAEDVLFSGDTLMHKAVGRTDLPGGNREKLVASVKQLRELPGETLVYAGHGPQTTLQAEFAVGTPAWSLLQ